MGTGGGPKQDPGGLGVHILVPGHPGWAVVYPLCAGTAPMGSGGTQTRAGLGTTGLRASLGLTLHPYPGHSSLSFSEPQLPHLDPGMTIPTVGKHP